MRFIQYDSKKTIDLTLTARIMERISDVTAAG